MLPITSRRFPTASAMDTFFYVLLSTGMVSVISKSCEESYYKGCRSQLQMFTDRPSLIFAKSSEELQAECARAESSLNCLQGYPLRCLSVENRTVFDDISGLRKVTLGMCSSESDLKSRYFSVLPCLQNVSSDLAYCHEKYERNQRDIDVVEYEDKVHLRCCSFDGYRRCLRIVAKTQGDCAEEMAEVLDDIAIRKGGNFALYTCADQFDRCRGSAHRTLGSSFLTLLAALSIVFVSTIRLFY